MVVARKFVYAKPFDGAPTAENFRIEEEVLPALKEGEILCEAEYLTVDPYMRPYMIRFPVGTVMIGGQIAKIIESKNEKFPKGEFVCGQFGWRTHTIVQPASDAENIEFVPSEKYPYILPSFGSLPRSLGLGYLGMPGNTAFFGLLEICNPQPNEVVAITGAAGAVGSLVGQIAKIKGCRVIGFCGSDEKCEWLTKELGFDFAFNYKHCDLEECLKKAAPNGIDCYFDNVGGDMSSRIINHMNDFGRISVCGCISAYNEMKAGQNDIPKASILQPDFIFKQLKMEGFLVYRWAKRHMEGINEILKWIQEGKVKYHETVTTGFENMPKAFMEMLKGINVGKAIVKA